MTPLLLPNLSNLESVLVLIPIILELESPILKSYILLWENEYGLEFQLLDLNPHPKSISTPERLLDFNHFPELVLVLVLSEFKSIIPSFYTPCCDKGVNKNDFKIILKI